MNPKFPSRLRRGRFTTFSFILAIALSSSSPAAEIPIAGIEAFHQGDSLDGDGSVLDAINGTGMNKVDPNDPSTWTINSTAWQDDWQGFQAPAVPNNTWAVIDLGAPAADLATMYLWNVQENAPGNQSARGMNQFTVYHAIAPTVLPPATSGTVTPYDFESGGWTAAGSGTLAVGTGIGDAGEAFDVSGAAGARYIGFQILSNHGDGARVGFGEVAFTDTLDPNAITLTGVVDPPDPADRTDVPIVAVTGFHQGDSNLGDGSLLRLIDTSIILTDPADPTQWTHSNAWQDDWQGFEAPGVTPNGTWAVLDLGEAVSGLQSLLLWNVNEGNQTTRGMNEFNLYRATAPTVAPPAADGTPDPYDFSSGGWTAIGGTESLPQASGLVGSGLDGTYDLSGIPATRYLGIEILSNHGAAARVGFAHAVILGGGAQGPHLAVTRDDALNELVFTWESQEGMLYNLRSETDPSNGSPGEWPIFGTHENIAATPTTNTLSIPFPADAERFFVIEEFPVPPTVVFTDDFESGQGDWVVGSMAAAGTGWELGVPANFGPATAHSLDNCFGTNIAAEYNFDAIITLTSPSIDLTAATGATLNYFQAIEIEAGFDFGTVSLLDAADDSLIEVLVPLVDGIDPTWKKVSNSLPATALGKSVKIQFTFTTDDMVNFAGWYLDDVEVTTP